MQMYYIFFENIKKEICNINLSVEMNKNRARMPQLIFLSVILTYGTKEIDKYEK